MTVVTDTLGTGEHSTYQPLGQTSASLFPFRQLTDLIGGRDALRTVITITSPHSVHALSGVAPRSGAWLSSPNADPLYVESTFHALVEVWRDDMSGVSSVSEMVTHPAYKAIIDLGKDSPELVTRLLLRELQDRPHFWFAALRAITGENPVRREQAGKLEEMSRAWLELGRERRLI